MNEIKISTIFDNYLWCFIHESVKILSIEFEFYSFPSPHNKGEKNGPFAQLPPPHKNMQIE
jgi:hypothetical protein